MGIVIRQSFYSSISAYIGVGIGYINAVILMPLFMEPDEIGLMRVIMGIALMLTTFSSFGTSALMIRYYHIKGSTQKSLNQLFTLCLLIVTVAFGVLVVILTVSSDIFFEFFESAASEVGSFLGLIILLISQMTIFNLLEAVLRSRKAILLPNIARDLVYKSLHMVVILLYGFEYFKFSEYLFSHLVVYASLVLVLLLPIIHNYNLRLDFSFSVIKNDLIKIVNFSTISIVAGLGMVIIIQIDQIMVTKYLGLTANGVYSIALFMAAVIEIPRKFISQISTPIVAEALVKKSYDQLELHYKQASINQLILGLLIFLLILVNLNSIYEIMPNGTKYVSGWWVFVIIGLVRLVDMGFSLNGEIIGYSQYYRFNLRAIMVLCVLAIGSNVVLIPSYGLYGAAFATLSSYLLFNCAKLVFIKVKFDFIPFTYDTLKILIISISIGLVFVSIPILIYPVIDVLFRSILLTGIFITLTYLSKVSNLFNEQLSLILQRMKRQVFH